MPPAALTALAKCSSSSGGPARGGGHLWPTPPRARPAKVGRAALAYSSAKEGRGPLGRAPQTTQRELSAQFPPKKARQDSTERREPESTLEPSQGMS